ncbi:hypothetical protein KC367_g4146 [Hortaea werneckii]|nr:hypothetical protein KC367_g4146 [Hortaea werneckii]
MTDAIAIYQPLDTSKHEFRLVRVSADDNGEIGILLDVFSLDSPPEYVGLSYCWTEHPPTIQITLNHLPFWVRPNLYDFLKRFARERKTDWVYIDALCINQANVTERSNQVILMGRVFRGAKMVIAWLGGRLPNDLRVTTHHKEIEEALSALHRASFAGQDLLTFVSQPTSEGHGRELAATHYRLFIAFASHAYWNRLWIVQELVFAQDFLLWCGRLHLTSCQLSALISILEGDFPQFKAFVPSLSPQRGWHMPSWVRHMEDPRRILSISSIYHWRRDFQINDSPRHNCDLLNAVNFTATYDCLLPHDHIFSIVGLTSSVIVVDYSMPMLELYLRTLAETLIDSSRGPLTPKASAIDFLIPLHVFWGNLLLNLGLSPFDPLVALATQALGMVLCLLAANPKSVEGVVRTNELARALSEFCHDNPATLKNLLIMQRFVNDSSFGCRTFARVKERVKVRILHWRLNRDMAKDANLTEAGGAGRTMPCSAWLELSEKIALEVVEAKNHQVQGQVARRIQM